MAPELVYPTGIPSLDDILGGGLPVSGNMLILGDPMCGKKPLIMQFVFEGLKMNMPGIFVLTDFGFPEWKKMMAASGWDISPYEKNGMLQVIDCYSMQFDSTLVDSGIVTYVDRPSNLSEISLKISSLQDQIVEVAENHRLGFHSLSSLLESNTTESAFRFIQFITGKFRRVGASAMYVVEKGMHDEQHIKMVEHLMDGVIEMSEDRLRVRGLVGASSTWHKYELAADGIKIKA
jgi:KaiC/GvpD/RAD55 family RecA-like ATPase